ncbi:MAG: MFS transporter, partial [Prevotellaceae bacterium]|nr:MFS transporter [Prevotellaceae bacterium]
CILLTPLFGSLYDRIGKGATLMIIGSVMLVFVHLCFTLPILEYWWFALALVIVLGVAFSLVPSAMWPSVPKIIPQKQLGSAYSLIFYIQNIGLSLVPVLIGRVIDKFATTVAADGGVTYNYTLPLSIFMMFGILSVFVALLLKWENKRKQYGLEEANMKR